MGSKGTNPTEPRTLEYNAGEGEEECKYRRSWVPVWVLVFPFWVVWCKSVSPSFGNEDDEGVGTQDGGWGWRPLHLRGPDHTHSPI